MSENLIQSFETDPSNLTRLGLLVADHVSAMLAYWDKNLVCRFANKVYLDWFGKSRDEMIGKITLPELLGPELYKKNLPFITAVLKGETQTFEREIPLPTGGTRPSLANYFPDIVNNEVVGFFVHVADITPIKKLEAQVSERNKLLLNFANTVSHNLRSYANNLSSMLDIVDEKLSDEQRKVVVNYFKSISRNFNSTINNLGQIVEVENLSNLQYQEIDFHDAIENVLMILRIQILASYGTVKNLVPPKTFVKANPAYIESIILNLISNALKYRHPDRKPEIVISCMDEPDYFILRVKDNGVGIELSLYGKDMFGMFKTFHGNADAKGVGLYITKFQVEAMGGKIEVKSKLNEGSTFSVYFKKH